MFAKREQIAVGQHRALWIAGGARGIELQNSVVRTSSFKGYPRLPLNHRPRFGFADNALNI